MGYYWKPILLVGSCVSNGASARICVADTRKQSGHSALPLVQEWTARDLKVAPSGETTRGSVGTPSWEGGARSQSPTPGFATLFPLMFPD